MINKKYYLTSDTETCEGNIDGKVVADNSFVYDVAWCIHDNKGNIVLSRQYIVYEIFFGMPTSMNSAYYAEKIPMYLDRITKKELLVKSFWNIRQQLLKDFYQYNCEAIIAYNALFDYKALNATCRYLSQSSCRYFCPYGLPWECSLKMCRQLVNPMKTYGMFCRENGFLTKHKKPRNQLKAETVYRYITNNPNFVESHTALEDVKIEVAIYAYLKRKHKKMVRGLWEKVK